ncbi:hypothetical protein RH915_01920 [Serpentinicella sp. ANB-PHB4]|uniref:hypothetical protein n=1 Tax=Serpentinicella sp. ANB-PHB4 TaxID=3074076 RepID=UPI002865EE7E|nr:hypothetical protein [Serpentinicella sp. ANB-PHB4]MDR5658239.1 hypothetical protein [Serpentinicella sp. ANB-PHB4]
MSIKPIEYQGSILNSHAESKLQNHEINKLRHAVNHAQINNQINTKNNEKKVLLSEECYKGLNRDKSEEKEKKHHGKKRNKNTESKEKQQNIGKNVSLKKKGKIFDILI